MSIKKRERAAGRRARVCRRGAVPHRPALRPDCPALRPHRPRTSPASPGARALRAPSHGLALARGQRCARSTAPLSLSPWSSSVANSSLAFVVSVLTVRTRTLKPTVVL